jgi:hypothetical protein
MLNGTTGGQAEGLAIEAEYAGIQDVKQIIGYSEQSKEEDWARATVIDHQRYQALSMSCAAALQINLLQFNMRSTNGDML